MKILDVLLRGRLRTVLIRAVTALSLLWFSGCLPAINHGPRVKEGPSFGVVGSITPGPRYHGRELSGAYVYGPVGISIGQGWEVQDDQSAGIYLGGHLPIPGIFYPQGDVYIQAPRSWIRGLDGGIGFSGGYHLYSPYVQLGRIDENGAGWYTTQALVMLPRRVKYEAPAFAGWLWAGSLARQWTSAGGRELQLFATGAAGRHSEYCDGSCRRFVFSFGANFDLIAGRKN